MEGKKTRLNNNPDFVVDRISDLPDSILGHILSFLPTNKAVATSILSKRWKFAWVTVHSLDFDFRERWEFAWATVHSPEEEEEKIMEFVRFVNRVLLLNDAGWLNKFSLNCSPHSFSPQIVSWINTAITRNVHELDLNVGDIDLPTSLFSCDSLRSLDLHGFILINDTTTVCLPRLKSLKIDRVIFESEEAYQKLISGCPILQYLKLHIVCDDDHDDDHDFTCIISSASLRRLEIYFVDTSCKLKLKASSLEYLRLYGSISEIFVEKGLTSLVEAEFNIDLVEHDFPNNSIVEIVREFDCVKFLTLSANVMRNYWRWQGTSNPHDHSRWTAPEEVPRFLSNSLKKVRLDGYKGLEDEREMIRYILEHGTALEVMQIYFYSMEDGEKLKLIQEIREFPRKSLVCKVYFSV